MDRQPPASVLIRLAHTTQEHPGFVDWLAQKASEGFGLGQPGDNDLSDEQWAETSELRYSILERTFLLAR